MICLHNTDIGLCEIQAMAKEIFDDLKITTEIACSVYDVKSEAEERVDLNKRSENERLQIC